MLKPLLVQDLYLVGTQLRKSPVKTPKICAKSTTKKGAPHMVTWPKFMNNSASVRPILKCAELSSHEMMDATSIELS